jgi:hypothetical protein
VNIPWQNQHLTQSSAGMAGGIQLHTKPILFTEVSEKLTASIFRVKESAKEVTGKQGR